MCQAGVSEPILTTADSNPTSDISISHNNTERSNSRDPIDHSTCLIDSFNFSGVPYRPDPVLEQSSLSVRLMHKPSRAQNELEKASDPTRHNSIINSFRAKESDKDSRSPQEYWPRGDPPDQKSPSELSPASPGLKLVRKKSGEIVKSLLKDNAQSVSHRSRSLPSTPTYKQVHFGGDNDVRYFKKKDKPAAISASNSPQLLDEEDDDDDLEIPGLEFDDDIRMRSLFDTTRKSYFEYYDDELNSHVDRMDSSTRASDQSSSPQHKDWLLSLQNYHPHDASLDSIRKGKSVFLENIFLAADKRFLLGQIAVLNSAYEKWVTVRYSIDNWSTIIEIQAMYVPDTPTVLKTHNYDRFMFKVSLDSFMNGFHSSGDPLNVSPPELRSELCVKYVVGGQEHWDNNEGKNYKFTLRKKTSTEHNLDDFPSSARSKQEIHKKRPKYSSSYLKKVKSDSSLTPRNDNQSKGQSSQSSTTSSSQASVTCEKDLASRRTSLSSNDFENNNYYLSSPLFSSISSKRIDAELRETNSQNWPKILNENNSLSPSAMPQASNYTERGNGANFQEFEPAKNATSLPSMSKDRRESMSYREFLDSYCFFNPSCNDNSFKTTLVMSDGPVPRYGGVVDGDTSPTSKPIYTVSSFLT